MPLLDQLNSSFEYVWPVPGGEMFITLINYSALNQINTKDKNVKELFSELMNHKYTHEIILSHLSGVDRQNVNQLMERIKTYLTG